MSEQEITYQMIIDYWRYFRYFTHEFINIHVIQDYTVWNYDIT